MENGLDKCSSLPSSDMKIGSHSGLLSRLINILSAKAGLVWEQEGPHTQVLAGSPKPMPGGDQASRRVLGPFQRRITVLISVKLTGLPTLRGPRASMGGGEGGKLFVHKHQ